MRYVFDSLAWEDYQFWVQTDKKTARRIADLLKDISRTPFEGIGKPEALRLDRTGWWSRRIDAEHRLVYRVEADDILIAQCRYHY